MGGYYYETDQGDMWDYIAWKVYGDEKKIEILLNAPENRTIMDVYIFPAKIKVWCPVVEVQTTAEQLPPWRK